VVVRHGGRRARYLYPCISAMETRVFRIGEDCLRKPRLRQTIVDGRSGVTMPFTVAGFR
jgi:hypothetical protein